MLVMGLHDSLHLPGTHAELFQSEKLFSTVDFINFCWCYRIFISKMTAAAIFGLPNLIRSARLDTNIYRDAIGPIEIYGPPGITLCIFLPFM